MKRIRAIYSSDEVAEDIICESFVKLDYDDDDDDDDDNTLQKLYPPEHVSYEYNSRFGSECVNDPFALNRDTPLLPAAWQPGLNVIFGDVSAVRFPEIKKLKVNAIKVLRNFLKDSGKCHIALKNQQQQE
uniref:Uncharacterized protein n=1 Tax=Glossina pallidipes TaxID=7398 RepID=A0A1A9ZAZ9_GLOPL